MVMEKKPLPTSARAFESHTSPISPKIQEDNKASRQDLNDTIKIDQEPYLSTLFERHTLCSQNGTVRPSLVQCTSIASPVYFDRSRFRNTTPYSLLPP